MGYYDDVEFKELKGKVFTEIKVDRKADHITFICDDNIKYVMYHSQDCCEDVHIEDICGDIEDLLNNPILVADESKSNECGTREEYYDSYTWTFYKLATVKGWVDIRWYGSSNGYYSEEVYLVKFSADEELVYRD